MTVPRKQVSVSIFSVAPVVSGDKGIGILTELAPSMKTVLLETRKMTSINSNLKVF